MSQKAGAKGPAGRPDSTGSGTDATSDIEASGFSVGAQLDGPGALAEAAVKDRSVELTFVPGHGIEEPR